MTVSQTPGTTDPTQTGATNGTSTSATSAVSNATKGLGQDAFLQLLVTQLQNQNPLQPQDPTQFVGELAQFSSLDMLTQINSSVQKLPSQIGSSSSPSSTSSTSSNGATSSPSSAPTSSTTPNSTGTSGGGTQGTTTGGA